MPRIKPAGDLQSLSCLDCGKPLRPVGVYPTGPPSYSVLRVAFRCGCPTDWLSGVSQSRYREMTGRDVVRHYLGNPTVKYAKD